MMKVYKEQGTTPLLGCLPMFLQMPILIALWTSINASVELRHAAFLPVWIIDLAAPDALIPFGGAAFNIPLVGSMIGLVTGFNLLPLLLCVVMYLQMKMNPQMSASTSPQQQSSQTMMKYMMPGMMLVFFYNAPSGLNLYFMTSTFAGLLEQYVIRKHIREKEAAEAAAVTTVAMPGKRFRGQKPKKPKGPFQIKR
ncbi:MAG: membrane protein insertase YidC [Phycisphaerae bacterium]|nr:membrane protein insertase YidC [Phycisphaerae bacterium]